MRRRLSSSTKKASYLWILLWVIASVLPFVPYSEPLWVAVWSDNPFSYLVFVPLFAFAWAGWLVWRDHRNPGDIELSYMFAFVLSLASGTLLVVGRTRWDLIFISHHVSLLLWPAWAISMAWWMFGMSVTRIIWKPMLYLLLCWPPLYTEMIRRTNPLLDNVANAGVRLLSKWANWITIDSGTGTYTVAHGAIHTSVRVASVCNGADSFLVMVILFPVIMISYRAGFSRKFLLVFIASLLALVSNVIRLWVIVWAIHLTGAQFALGILHPVLGVLLFLGMFSLVLRFGRVIGLKPIRFQRMGAGIEGPGTTGRAIVLGMSAVLTVLSWPLLGNTPGTLSHPQIVKTDKLMQLLPDIPGWHKTIVGQFDEASTLGPGAKSTTVTYTTVQGDYALAEIWWTYHPMILKGYSQSDCLLFHGSKIIDTQHLTVSKGMRANVYAIYLPPLKVGAHRDVFIDTVYSYTGSYHGKTVDIRMELATPVLLRVSPTTTMSDSIINLVTKILNPAFDHVRQIPPADVNQTVHLHNYVTIVREISHALLQSQVGK